MTTVQDRASDSDICSFIDSATRLTFGELDHMKPEDQVRFSAAVTECQDDALIVTMWPKPEIRISVASEDGSEHVLHIIRPRSQ